MIRKRIFECLMNSHERIDSNKTLAFIGAIVGAIILIIAAVQNYTGLEWLFSAYLVATLGQLPSKGLNELSRLKIEARKPSHPNAFHDGNDINVVTIPEKQKEIPV